MTSWKIWPQENSPYHPKEPLAFRLADIGGGAAALTNVRTNISVTLPIVTARKLHRVTTKYNINSQVYFLETSIVPVGRRWSVRRWLVIGGNAVRIAPSLGFSVFQDLFGFKPGRLMKKILLDRDGQIATIYTETRPRLDIPNSNVNYT